MEDYCQKCDYDLHRCPGCGEPLNHGEFQCDKCRDELMDEYDKEFPGEASH